MNEIAKIDPIFYARPRRPRGRAPMAEYKGPKFSIVESNKTGLGFEESLLVVRKRRSYLRVVGSERDALWNLWTTTANEDDGSYIVHDDRKRLLKAAILLAAELGTTPQEWKDRIGRRYVTICMIERKRPDEDLRELLIQIVERFFELFDGESEAGTGRSDELVDLYQAVSSDHDGGDVYLSDGLWLSSDGSLHDRGR